MERIEFKALVKKVESKALVSGDKSYRALLETEDARIQQLIQAPADKQVKIVVETE